MDGNTSYSNTNAFTVGGGQIQILKAIEQNRVKASQSFTDADGCNYDCGIEDIRIKSIYMNGIQDKQDNFKIFKCMAHD